MSEDLPPIALDGDGPLYEQIRRAIGGLILSGAWAPGTRVPSEHALMARFHASRMTVHRALSALAEEGLILRRRRSGTVVATPPASHTVLGILSIPEEIASKGRTHRFELLARDAGPADPETTRLFGGPTGDDVVRVSGLHHADETPHVLEDRIIRLAAAPQALDADFEAVPPGTWLLDHVPWSDAEHVISAVAANAAEADLLGLDPGAPCLLVERRTWAGSALITSVRLLYPGARHRFVGRFGPYDRGGRKA